MTREELHQAMVRESLILLDARCAREAAKLRLIMAEHVDDPHLALARYLEEEPLT